MQEGGNGTFGLSIGAKNTSGVASANASMAIWRCPYKQRKLSCAARDRALREIQSNNHVLCLWEGNTAHVPEQISYVNKPLHFRWDRGCNPIQPGTLFAVMSETHASQSTACCGNDTYKIFMATEPPDVFPETYTVMRSVASHFDLVLSLGGPEFYAAQNVLHWPYGSSWVPLDEWRVYPKSRLCSIIVSNKMEAPGHKLRHEAVAMLRSVGFDCEVLGRGYKPMATKREALEDFMFSIVIENSISGSGAYMTEKIIDALACGTVPVYWGAETVPQIFGEGVITWNSLEDLRALLPSLTPQLYAELEPHIAANVERARSFVPPERWLWENIFSCAYDWLAKNSMSACT